MARTRSSSSTSPTAGQRIGQWLQFTLIRDNAPTFYRLPHLAANWLFLALFAAVAYFLWRTAWLPLLAVLLVALLYTAGRAARHIPARNRIHTQLYEATKRQCGHGPVSRTSTSTAETYVPVTRWRSTKPAAGTIRYAPRSLASKVGTRALVERTVDQVLAPPPKKAWVFDHSASGQFSYIAVDAEDPRVKQRATRSWIDQTADRMFAKAKDSLEVDISWDQNHLEVPTAVAIVFGAESFDKAGRERLERQFDENVQRDGVEWIYQWEPGQLLITAADPDSDEGQQKRVAREVSSMAMATLGATGRHTAVDVTRWLDNTPASVSIDIAQGKFTTGVEQRAVANPIIDTLAARWPDRAWIPTWETGPSTILTLDAVPRSSVPAMKRASEGRFITAMETTMRIDRGGVAPDLTVTKWRTETDDNEKVTVVTPAAVEIHLGSFVADNEAQFKVEEAFDRLSADTGFRFDWDLHEDTLRLTEFPALPPYAWFPDPGTEEFRRQEALARKGIITLGPAKGGGFLEVHYNKVPHWGVGGGTGSGKSVLLTIFLFWALWLPDEYELLVHDPKRTDFTWTQEFPNVRFAGLPQEIADLVDYAHKEMDRRQTLLQKYGVEKMSMLRELAAAGKVSDPVPGRLIIFFDEIGAYFNKSTNEEVAVLQSDTRSKLEQITMLGRAVEVNLVSAAQKPTKDSPGTMIRSQTGGKVGVGYMDAHTSIQVLGDARASRVDRSRTPKGRSWCLAEGSGETIFQGFYLPKRNERVDFADGEFRHGVLDLVRDRLHQQGWVQTSVTNSAGGVDPRWVRPDMVDNDDS